MPQVHYADYKKKSPDTTRPEFHYQCLIEDKADPKMVLDHILATEISTSIRELLSLSSKIHKQMKELMMTRKVKAAAYVSTNYVYSFQFSLNACDCHEGLVVAKESHMLRSIIPIVDRSMAVERILDSGCQIVDMSRAVWMLLNKMLNPSHTISMQSANGTVGRSLEITQDLSFHFRSIKLKLQIHVIDELAYDILLGHPFNVLTELTIRNFRNKDQMITITNPNDWHCIETMQTCPCTAQA